LAKKKVVENPEVSAGVVDEYPKWLTHPSKDPVEVHNAEEEAALGDEWSVAGAPLGYPKLKYHAVKEPVLVNSVEEEKALGPGWNDYGRGGRFPRKMTFKANRAPVIVRNQIELEALGSGWAEDTSWQPQSPVSEDVMFPHWLYHAEHGAKLFHSAEEVQEAGAGWQDTPIAAGE
jgi:hypothetical protein